MIFGDSFSFRFSFSFFLSGEWGISFAVPFLGRLLKTSMRTACIHFLRDRFAQVNLAHHPIKNAPNGALMFSGGEWGIRTPGPVTVNSFQDCRNRPLCQLSATKIIISIPSIKIFFRVFFLSDYRNMTTWPRYFKGSSKPAMMNSICQT